MPKSHEDALTDAARSLIEGAVAASPSVDPTAKAEGDSPDGTPAAEPEAIASPAAPETVVEPDYRKVADDRQTFITQLLRENQEARSRMSELEEIARQAVAPKAPDIASNPALETLEALGIPKESMMSLLSGLANQAADARFRPMAEALQAKTTMASQEPLYADHAVDMEKFVESDPNTRAVVMRLQQAGDYLGAELAAWHRYIAVKGPALDAAAAAKSVPAPTAADKAKAGVPTQNAKVRGEVGKDNAKLKAAAEHAARTGDSRAYMTEFVKSAYPEFYANLEKQAPQRRH